MRFLDKHLKNKLKIQRFLNLQKQQEVYYGKKKDTQKSDTQKSDTQKSQS